MKIAMMVRGYLPVPRPKDMVYAPIDLEVAIGEGLAAKGHSVDFYAPAGSKLKVPTINKNLEPLIKDNQQFQELITNTEYQMHNIPQLWDFYLAKEMFEQARLGKYDVLHFTHPEIAMPLAQMYPEVTVTYTLHDPLLNMNERLYKMFHTPNQFYISISNSQRQGAPMLPYVATVYNGVDINDYHMAKKHDGFLLCAGRIVPEKGVKEAVQVARKTGEELVIIGPIYKSGRQYFNKSVKPYLNDKIQYLGYVEREKLKSYMQQAKALILPLQWEEPFGMTMIEAMACGTPVIVNRRGSAPEIVADGQTGYLVNGVKEMAEAIGKINKINRAACRRHVEKHFSNQVMVEGYEKAFAIALGSRAPAKIKLYNKLHATAAPLRLL